MQFPIRFFALLFSTRAVTTTTSASSSTTSPSTSPTQSCAPFPTSTINLFSSSFQQPIPPTIVTAFRAHFNQHKYNLNLSHITTGFVYFSPSLGKVRADEVFDITVASSLFDYTNISSSGLVSNTLYSYSPTIFSQPTIFEDYVNPGFPLFTDTLLQDGSAVFTGLVEREKAGLVASWSIMYQGVLPVTLFITECGIVVGYDFFSPEERTRVVTEFFDIVVGEVEEEVFKFPG